MEYEGAWQVFEEMKDNVDETQKHRVCSLSKGLNRYRSGYEIS
jgi:hypothetical protein